MGKSTILFAFFRSLRRSRLSQSSNPSSREGCACCYFYPKPFDLSYVERLLFYLQGVGFYLEVSSLIGYCIGNLRVESGESLFGCIADSGPDVEGQTKGIFIWKNRINDGWACAY